MRAGRALVAALGLVAACGGGGDGGRATCDDAEAAMQRLVPERSRQVERGAFARVCRDRPAEFPQARIDCIVAAKASGGLAACEPGGAPAPSDPPAPSAPAAAGDPAPAPPAGPPAKPAWKQVPAFGVQVRAPSDTTVEARDTNAHVGNGRFKLNLFVVDEFSQQSAKAQRASLMKEPGFAKFLVEEVAGPTWRYDYELAGGKFGTSSRIAVQGRLLDCGVHKVDAEVLAAVAAACASAKPL
jgi:hypothetical protein